MTQYYVNEFAVESAFPLVCDAAACPLRAFEPEDCLTFRRASLADLPCTLRKIRPQLLYDVGDGFLLEPMTVHGMLSLHIDYKGRVLTVDCSDSYLEVAAAWATHAGLGAATLTHGGVPLHGAAL